MNILCVGDIHFGKLNNDDYVYECLKKNFIGYAEKIKPDLIVICGDSYDCRVMVDSSANINFNKFISDCRDTGAIIIVIEGTESHERYQINGLLHYVSDKFFIVNSVTKLNILGMKLLILPEEYVKNENYYDSYLNDKYDFIFGHGMSKHVGFSSTVSEEIVKSPYVWDAKVLKSICKNYTVFGHIHIHSEYNNFIYTGSFSRLNFGEMEPKGFIHIYNKNGKFEYKFVENKDAPTFTDIYESKLPDDTEGLLKHLRGYQENNNFVRIVIDQSDDNKFNTIKGFVINHKNCCIKRVINTTEKRLEDISNNIKEKQSVLIDKMKDYNNLDFIQITQKIAKDEYHETFTKEEINEVLNTKEA